MGEADFCRSICIVGMLLAIASKASARNLCGMDQVVVRKQDGFTYCHDCLECPPGQGFSHSCGRSTVLPEDEVKNFRCIKCVTGETYSDSNGNSQCEQCGTCFDDQVVDQECTVVSPTKCGKSCYSTTNYLSSNSGKCEPCSRCCDDSDVMEECTQKGNPAGQSCSIYHHCPETPTPPSNTTQEAKTPKGPGGTANPGAGHRGGPTGYSLTFNTKKPMQAIIASLCVAFLIVAVVLWWRICAQKQFPECCLEPQAEPEEIVAVSFNNTTQQVTITDSSSHRHSIHQKKLSDFTKQIENYEKVCMALDTKIVGCGNYEQVGKNYGADIYEINSFKTHPGGPSKAIFEWLMAEKPSLTVGEFVQVLQSIHRNDVVKMFYQ